MFISVKSHSLYSLATVVQREDVSGIATFHLLLDWASGRYPLDWKFVFEKMALQRNIALRREIKTSSICLFLKVRAWQ